ERLLTCSWPKETALRVLLTGGDTLRGSPSARLPFQLVNHYGPTESTVLVTAASIASGTEDPALPPAIGRPIANTQVYGLDPHMQIVPIGVHGELYVGGLGVARCYFQCPEQTAERFLPDSFSTEAGSRLYRTGDIVRYRGDRKLTFVGRRDHQV